MRIVGGEFRGRALVAPAGAATRPTSDRVREALFDILIHRYGDPVTGARVLDLFAGTGALGLEALSRGAASCLMVEQAAEARGAIRRNIEALGVTGRARIFRRDATRLGPVGTMAPFSLAFADPPYRKGLGEAAVSAALLGGWLTADAILICEEAAGTAIAVPDGLALLEERIVGDTKLVFFQREAGE